MTPCRVAASNQSLLSDMDVSLAYLALNVIPTSAVVYRVSHGIWVGEVFPFLDTALT